MAARGPLRLAPSNSTETFARFCRIAAWVATVATARNARLDFDWTRKTVARRCSRVTWQRIAWTRSMSRIARLLRQRLPTHLLSLMRRGRAMRVIDRCKRAWSTLPKHGARHFLDSHLNTRVAMITSTTRFKLASCTGWQRCLARLTTEHLNAPHFAPKAKRVIYLFQSGGPSQFETLDPNPRLRDRQGQPLAGSFTGFSRHCRAVIGAQVDHRCARG